MATTGTANGGAPKERRVLVDRRAALQRSFERTSIASAAAKEKAIQEASAPTIVEPVLPPTPEDMAEQSLLQKNLEAQLETVTSSVKDAFTTQSKAARGLGAMLQSEISKRVSVSRASIGGTFASMGEKFSNAGLPNGFGGEEKESSADIHSTSDPESTEDKAPEPQAKQRIMVDRRQSLTRKLQQLNDQREESEQEQQPLEILKEEDDADEEMDERLDDDQGFSLSGPVFSDDEGGSSPVNDGRLSNESENEDATVQGTPAEPAFSDDEGSSSPVKDGRLSNESNECENEGTTVQGSPVEAVQENTSPEKIDELSSCTRSTSASPARESETTGSEPSLQAPQASSRSSHSQDIDTPERPEQSSGSESRADGAEHRIITSHDDVAPEKPWQFDRDSVISAQAGPQKHYQYSSGSKRLSQKEIQGLIAKGGLTADEIRRLQKESVGDANDNEEGSGPEKHYQFSSGSKRMSQNEIQGLIAKGGLSAEEIRRLQKECSDEIENDEESGPEKQYQFSSGTKQLSQSEIQGLLAKGGLSGDEIRRLQRSCTEDSQDLDQEGGPKKGYQFSSGNAKQLSAKEIEATLAKGYLDSKEVRRLREELKRLQASEAVDSEAVPSSRTVKAVSAEEDKRVSVRDRASHFEAKKSGGSQQGPAPKSFGGKGGKAQFSTQFPPRVANAPAEDVQSQDAVEDVPSQEVGEGSE